MKRILTLIVLAMHCAALTAQSVFPTPADQPVWHMSVMSQQTTQLFSISVAPDEVQACGQSWGVVHSVTTLPNGQTSPPSISCYYRQEGARVYFRQNLNCQDREYLMYDFSLEIGDSVWVGMPGGFLPSDTVLLHVINTFSTCTNGVERKSLQVRGEVEDPSGFFPPVFVYLHWVEWIGHIAPSHHPFYPGECLFAPNCEGFYQLQCMQTNAGIAYYTPGAPCTPEYSRIHVNANVAGSLHNGIYWESAFRKLQDAIAVAEAGDTILVAQGTYFPTDDADREKHFLLKNGVVMLGGYNGAECLSSERDPVLYETILSGDIGVPNDSTDNSYHVLYAFGTDSTTVLDGFTVTRGQGIHPDGSAYFGHLQSGGGLYLGASATVPLANPVIRNCRFIRNVALFGGAIYCDGVADGRHADPALENCAFEWNHSLSAGGAIYRNVSSHPDRAFVISNCRFGFNRAYSEGGAIYFLVGGNTTVFANTNFHDNTSGSSGGAIYYETPFDQTLTIIDSCDFVSNNAREAGGVFFAAALGSNIEKTHQIQISHTVFEKNRGLNSTGGALVISAFYKHHCHVTVSQCSFLENYSIYHGAGIYTSTSADASMTLKVDQCRFEKNEATPDIAAAIYMRPPPSPLFSMSTLILTNSLFANNEGVLALLSGEAGAVDALIQNCTFYRNGEFPFVKNWNSNFNYTTFYNRMEIANSVIWEPEAIPGRLFYNNSLANPSLHDYNLHHNLISTPDCALPGGDVACGEGNIFAVWPAFLDTLNDDFHLAACSPAINAGTNEGLATLPTDLDGNPRIMEGVADMGAYERHAYRIDSVSVSALTCFGDSNGRVSFNLNGNAPYAYNWQNSAGQTGTSSEDLRAGSYQFSITDALGCSDTILVQLSEPESMEANFVIGNASSAAAADGSIALEMLSGGTPPYRFFWNTGDTTNFLSNLLPGFYELAILDANDCTQALSFEVSFTNATGDVDDSWQLQVSPNPLRSGERLRIWQSGAITYDLKIKVSDAQGRQVADFQLNNEVMYWDTQALPAGIYSLQWHRMDGRYGTLKIVVL